MVPTVSFVVITRDRCAELLECLGSLVVQTVHPAEFVLVDNGSSDQTVAEVKERFPEVRLITAGTNLGVAGGRNRGLRAARGEICIVIDDDAQLLDIQAAERVRLRFCERPELAVIAFRIRHPETHQDIRAALPRRDKRLPGERQAVATFCGAGFAIRKRAWEAVGGFWEELFYAGEELELSYRLLSANYELEYGCSIVVMHNETQRARPQGQWIYHQTRNRPWIAVRHLPLGCVLTTTAAWWLKTGWTAVRHHRIAAFAAGVRDCLRGFGKALSQRRPLRFQTLRQLAARSGRLWY